MKLDGTLRKICNERREDFYETKQMELDGIPLEISNGTGENFYEC